MSLAHDLQKKQRPAKKGFSGVGLKVGIVCARWNETIIENLLQGCTEELYRLGVQECDITVVRVPGSFEVPMGVKRLIQLCPSIDAVVAIGCLIKGETMHFEYINEAVCQAIMRLGQDTGIPVIFGVLACLTEAQASLRAGLSVNGKVGHNHGVDWGNSAVEMSLLKRAKSVEELAA